MQILKYFMLFLILVACSLIGRIVSKKYINRVKELEEFKNALNIFETKIRFTYEPIPKIFSEISQNTSKNIGQIFKTAKEKMKDINANTSWEQSVDEVKNLELTKEDKYVLKTLAKELGQTDVEGQVSQIKMTKTFLETQIKEAKEIRYKNEKMYNKLGTIVGLAIVIILF